jgi:hypothetical protein|tara:strand:- start:402 stop:617 length:216 start_codon:yes stop_codon:yes gene_type:complete
MKNYINNTYLSITYILQGEVETSVFDTDQEFKDFMLEHDVFLIVSTSREYTEIPDTEIVENYNALQTRFGL